MQEIDVSMLHSWRRKVYYIISNISSVSATMNIPFTWFKCSHYSIFTCLKKEILTWNGCIVLIKIEACPIYFTSWRELLSLQFFVTVEVLLYSPNRPLVDISAIFMWLMAVGTIVCASLWPEFIAYEQVDERYNQLTRKVFLYTTLSIAFNNKYLDSCVARMTCKNSFSWCSRNDYHVQIWTFGCSLRCFSS